MKPRLMSLLYVLTTFSLAFQPAAVLKQTVTPNEKFIGLRSICITGSHIRWMADGKGHVIAGSKTISNYSNVQTLTQSPSDFTGDEFSELFGGLHRMLTEQFWTRTCGSACNVNKGTTWPTNCDAGLDEIVIFQT